MRAAFAVLAFILGLALAPSAPVADPAGLVLAAGSGGKTGIQCVPGEAPTASTEAPREIELAQGSGAACALRCRDSLSSCESGCRDADCRSRCSSRYSSCLATCPR